MDAARWSAAVMGPNVDRQAQAPRATTWHWLGSGNGIAWRRCRLFLLFLERVGLPVGNLRPPKRTRWATCSVSTQRERLGGGDQAHVADAGLVAVDHAGRFQAAKRARDDRQVELQADARQEVVAGDELGDRAAQALVGGIRHRLAVVLRGREVGVLLGDAETEAGAVFAPLGGRVDRAQVAGVGEARRCRQRREGRRPHDGGLPAAEKAPQPTREGVGHGHVSAVRLVGTSADRPSPIGLESHDRRRTTALAAARGRSGQSSGRYAAPIGGGVSGGSARRPCQAASRAARHPRAGTTTRGQCRGQDHRRQDGGRHDAVVAAARAGERRAPRVVLAGVLMVASSRPAPHGTSASRPGRLGA